MIFSLLEGETNAPAGGGDWWTYVILLISIFYSFVENFRQICFAGVDKSIFVCYHFTRKDKFVF